MSPPVLHIPQGSLRGRKYTTLSGLDFYGFLGIPFAEPPVGNLRFKAPVPASSWTGVRDATRDGNMCTQLQFAIAGPVVGDEDCLYLNVFTPTLTNAEKPLPVIIFIPGGSFISGSNDSETYGPHFLIEKGVVCVTINYRLGIFGFLNLGIPGAQGNMGLKDQVEAFKWVQRNIAFFNGDPNNVTLCGFSAGAACVQMHCLSPMSVGLFHKAIVQSGSAINYWAQRNNSKDLAFFIAHSQRQDITDVHQLLEYLKTLRASELALYTNTASAVRQRKYRLDMAFVPSVEKIFPDVGSFLTDNSLAILKRDDFLKVPMIAGFCRHEGLFSCAIYPKLVRDTLTDKDLMKLFPYSLGDSKLKSLEGRLKRVYLDNIKPEEEEDKFLVDFLTDVDLLGGIYTSNRIMARSHSSLYFYEFTYDGELNQQKKTMGIKRRGTCHADDVGYICYMSNLPVDCPKTDELVRERMVTMWTNFAKFENPTPETSALLPVIWKPLTEESPDYLIIDENLTSAKNLLPERMAIYEEMYFDMQCSFLEK